MLLVASSPELDRHDIGGGHPERRARLAAALDGIAEAGLSDAVVNLAPRRATEEELARVHPVEYLEALRAFCDAGGGAIDPDTIAVPGSWDTALLASGAVLAAVDALAEGAGETAFVCERPPGHHATAQRAMGFCLLNNVAVAAAHLAERSERVLVVDWDVHHGNGTQEIFWDDPRVMYVSVHQWPLYPGSGRASETGGPSAAGLTVNVPLPERATGDVVLRALDEVVAPAVERFSPTWVLVSAGFDAHRADPLAGLELTAGDFADIALRVKGFAPGPGRMALVLEGGYDLEALKLSVGASLSALMGNRFRPEPASSGGPGAEGLAEARRWHEASSPAG
ncbi:MAG TPA: histone deacetylase [Acidimicrobiales bacterium]|nr:histone deacetylase [Acidimicrobiales bacterium]